MRDISQFYLDIAILIGIGVVIYYLRVQSTGDIIGPADSIQSLLGLNN